MKEPESTSPHRDFHPIKNWRILMYTPKGKFGWYELMTPDTAASATFYSSVIGWGTKEMGSPEAPYTVFLVGEHGVAGMMPLPPGAPPSWIGYIHVDDVDAHCAKITEGGATIWKQPTDVPGMLRFAVASDPQGAAFVLFTSNPDMKTPDNFPVAPTPGTIGWNELYAADLESAWTFYSTYFGWTKLTDMDMGAMGTYRLFDEGDNKPMGAGGIMTKPPAVPRPYWGFYFNVDSTSAAIERTTAAGGSLLNGPSQVPGGGWIATAADPQGVVFSVVSQNK